MRAVLKASWIDSDALDLASYQPDDPSRFGLSIQLRIGLDDGDAADDFSVFVCSPGWVTSVLARDPAFWGRSVVVVALYDIEQILGEIRRKVEACAGANWGDISRQLSAFLSWEFESYQERL